MFEICNKSVLLKKSAIKNTKDGSIFSLELEFMLNTLTNSEISAIAGAIGSSVVVILNKNNIQLEL